MSKNIILKVDIAKAVPGGISLLFHRLTEGTTLLSQGFGVIGRKLLGIAGALIRL